MNPAAPDSAPVGEIDVWLIAVPVAGMDLVADARFRDDSALLTADEARRAARYRVEGPRRRFVTTRAALRCLLGERLGLPAAAVPILTDAHGKPRVLGGPAFNVSHCEELAAIAIGSGVTDLGVDLESSGHIDRHVAAAMLDLADAAALPDPTDAQALLRLWTVKEAFLKATGLGFAADPRTVRPDQRGQFVTLPDWFTPADWHWWDIGLSHTGEMETSPQPDYRLAVVWAGPVGRTVVLRTWRWQAEGKAVASARVSKLS